jgi:hypothetical protein
VFGLRVVLRATYRTRAFIPTLDIVGAFVVMAGHLGVAIFDKQIDFVLDSEEISPIIYIWYEGGWLSPPVVTAKRTVGG